MSMRIVVALGGNALGATLPEQAAAVRITARVIVDLVEQGYEVVIVHGNGPQVGIINNAMNALCHEDCMQGATPLSVCGAMSQAYIGYDIQNALRAELLERGLNKDACTVVTQVVVNADDPAFSDPTKPIGKFLSEQEAKQLQEKTGFLFKMDAGRGYRRYVASPKPVEIIEAPVVKKLLAADVIPIACGGGGIPVIRIGDRLKGASAVIDKDYAAELLAQTLDADVLLILTAIKRVAVEFGTPNQRFLAKLTPEQARAYIEENQFAPGSMLPKVEAAVKFAESRRGRQAIIAHLEQASDAISGHAGTSIQRE